MRLDSSGGRVQGSGLMLKNIDRETETSREPKGGFPTATVLLVLVFAALGWFTWWLMTSH